MFSWQQGLSCGVFSPLSTSVTYPHSASVTYEHLAPFPVTAFENTCKQGPSFLITNWNHPIGRVLSLTVLSYSVQGFLQFVTLANMKKEEEK